MPKLSPQREAATRTMILRAARDVFVARGFHEATTQDVARAAGISVGSIYNYFPSKDELIRESVLAANQAETDAVLEDVRSEGTAQGRLARAIAGWYRFTIEAPGVSPFLTEAWAAANRRPPIRDVVARRRERILTVASVLLREGLADGELDADVDVDRIARSITALLDGLVVEHVTTGVPPPLEDVQRRVLLLVGATPARHSL